MNAKENSMKTITIILLLITFTAAAKAEKGVVVKVLPDKITLPVSCEAQTNLKAKNPYLFYTCRNASQGLYFLEFRLNDGNLVENFKKNSPNIVINESQFTVYSLYDINGEDTKGNKQISAHYCTQELCLDLVGDYEQSLKASITSQLKGEALQNAITKGE